MSRASIYYAIVSSLALAACDQSVTHPLSKAPKELREFAVGQMPPSAAAQISTDQVLVLHTGQSQTWHVESDLAGARSTRRLHDSRRPSFSTRNSSVASVSPLGVITGVGNGTTAIVSRIDNVTEWLVVSVGTISTISLSQPALALAPGDVQRVTAGGGSSGVSFSTFDTTVATVRVDGTVLAVAAGNTWLLAAAADGREGLASISVSAAMNPAVVAVPPGSVIQMSAGPLSQACVSAVRRWTVRDTLVARISASGLLTALAEGVSQIGFQAGACQGSVPVLVSGPAVSPPSVPPPSVPPPSVPPPFVPPPAGPPPSSPAAATIAVALVQFSSASGMLRTSNGIPLPAGALFPNQLGFVRLILAAQEQSIFVRPLAGTYSDGSLRAIQLQAAVTAPGVGNSVTGVLAIGTARQSAVLSEAGSSTTLTAAILPTSAGYLVSTNVAGPLMTAADVPSSPSALRAHDGDFWTMAPTIFSQFPNAFARGIAVYEHLLTHYQAFLRTADPRWYQIAWQMGESYRAYVESTYAPEWHISTEGMVVHYWMTGDERARAGVGKMTAWLTGTVEYIYKMDTPDGGLRLRGRALLGELDCRLIECDPGQDGYSAPFTNRYNLAVLTPLHVQRLISTQAPSGLFPGSTGGGGQKNYMVGGAIWALARYYDEISSDAGVLAAIKKSLDYMWTSEWVVGQQGFRYCTYAVGDCNTNVEPGLNNLILPAYAWYYAKTGDETYKTRADAIFLGTRQRRNEWLGFTMQFDQAHYRAANYYAWRNR